MKGWVFVLAVAGCTTQKSSASSSNDCSDVDASDFLCQSLVDQILQAGGTYGTCASKDQSVVQKFGVACSKLETCFKCTGMCPSGTCNDLFDGGAD
jgi:hypothetical protein